ncbi:MAG: DUF2098 domain-containing protein [Methanosphaera sp.]|nr:DUF2098 domain-containing protein [Methanosphaera sp.]
MSVTDKLGREIEIGSYIIYTNVGTIGEVLDIRTDENGSWVQIAKNELTKLWYNTDYVELTDEKYVKKFDKDEDGNDKELSADELKEKIKREISAEMGEGAVGGG